MLSLPKIEKKSNVMNKIKFLVAAFFAVILFSCEEKKTDEPPVTVVSVDDIPAIVEAHGTVGEGTSMNVLEFINDEGDTLSIMINDQTVIGGVAAGDEIMIVYNVKNDDYIASTAINLTALQHVWSQKGADGGEQSLEINPGGRASTYSMNIDYSSWEVRDGMLLLHSPKKIGDESPAVVDTFEIMQLTADSLVLVHGDLVTEFECYN